MSSLHCSSFASSKALPSSVERDGCRTATSSNFERRFDCANGCKRRTIIHNSLTTRTPVSRTNESRDDFPSRFDDRGEEEEERRRRRGGGLIIDDDDDDDDDGDFSTTRKASSSRSSETEAELL